MGSAFFYTQILPISSRLLHYFVPGNVSAHNEIFIDEMGKNCVSSPLFARFTHQCASIYIAKRHNKTCKKGLPEWQLSENLVRWS